MSHPLANPRRLAYLEACYVELDADEARTLAIIDTYAGMWGQGTDLDAREACAAQVARWYGELAEIARAREGLDMAWNDALDGKP